MRILFRRFKLIRQRRRLARVQIGAGGAGFMLQGAYHPIRGHNPSPLPMLLGLAVAVAAIATGQLLVLGVPRLKRRVNARRRRRRNLRQAAGAEARARAMMSELCPHGWRAQITLFGDGDELPPDAPGGGRARVALDWAELQEEPRGVAVVRRVWGASIADALDAMIADRRTDETLEQIEQSAGDGSLWPDL